MADARLFIHLSDRSRVGQQPGFAVAGVVVCVAWIFLAWPWLSGAVTIPWDAKAQFQPQVQFLAQSLWRGESPFWAPFVFSGHPQIADPQAMILSPPFLMLALVDPDPSLWALDATVFAAILVAALALLAALRDEGFAAGAAALAAISFAFGAAMSWRVQHTGQILSMVYLVVALWLLLRGLRSGSIGYGAAAGLVAGLMVLGRDQVALIGVYVLIAVVLAHWLAGRSGTDDGAARSGDASAGERFTRSLPPLIAGGVVGVLVIALPVLMTALVAEASNRPEIDLEGAGRGSLHPALLVTLLAPDVFGASGAMENFWGPPSFAWHDTGLYIAQNMGVIYVGAVPALLIVWGVLSGELLRREILFVTVATAVMLVYALGWYTPVFALLHGFLPGIDFFRRPADAVFLIGLGLAVMAGAMAHRLLAGRLPPPRLRVVITGAVVVAAGLLVPLWLAYGLDRVERALPPLLMSGGVLVAAGCVIVLAWRLQPIRPLAAAGLLIGFTVGDLALFNGPNTSSAMPPAYYDVLEPNTANETIRTLEALVATGQASGRRDRVELAGLGFHWPNASLTHGLENTLGYNPLRLGLYSRATGAGDTAGLPGQRQFSPLMPSYRSPFAELLGLRFIATGVPAGEIDPRLSPQDLRLVARTADGYIYENPRALPRVLYATEARAADFERLLAEGGMPDLNYTRTVLLESAGTARAAAGREPGEAETVAAEGSARLVSYGNTEVVVAVEGPGGFLVLNDVWQAWWTATIDGRPVDVLRANVAFRAVALPPGRHEVRFVFRPIAGALATFLARLGFGH